MAIPFGVVSTANLLLAFNTAKAETLWERGGVEKHGVFTKEQILERGGQWEEFKDFFTDWTELGRIFLKIIDWINHLPENLPRYSAEILASVYEFLSGTILLTPLFLFNSTNSLDTVLKFSGVAILTTIILTMVEAIKRMLKKKHTDSNTVYKRFFLAITASGFSPFIFTGAFQIINMVTKAIASLGKSEISRFELFSSYNEHIPLVLAPIAFATTGLDTFLLLAFDVAVIALLIPITLQAGRRFWDLLCLSSMSPLALTAWVFDDYKHYTSMWWQNVKKLSMTQIVYAAFIAIMGIFMYSTRGITEGGGLILKLIIILGGLNRMLNMPQFVKSRTDQGDDIFGMFDNMMKSGTKVWKTVLPTPIRTMISRKVKHGTTSVTELRKKTGKRYVGNL
jgi:hypothetical protein